MNTQAQHYLLLLVLILTACSPQRGYTGPSRSDTANVKSYGVTIVSVNGVKGDNSSAGVDVAPGKNTIVFTVDPTDFGMGGLDRQTWQLEMNAQPNKVYVIGGPRGGAAGMCAWEVSSSSGVSDYMVNAGCAHPAGN